MMPHRIIINFFFFHKQQLFKLFCAKWGETFSFSAVEGKFSINLVLIYVRA
jgi:hypothetical protein